MRGEWTWSENLRDQFAMAALPALVETVNDGYHDSHEEAVEKTAKMAYELADAMLLERERSKCDTRPAA